MAHQICRTTTELPGYMFTQFRVAPGTQLYAGDVYIAETLDETLGYGNWINFEPEQIEDVSVQIPAIILNGTFETLSDGRRSKGNSDYTTYVYQAGEIASAVRLLPEIKLEIGFDCISNGSDIDDLGYLIPENGHGLLKYVKSINDVNTKVYLVVEALKSFRLGGRSGSEFTNTVIARVKYNVAEKQVNPEITAIQANVTQGLQVGNDNVKSGATVLTMQAVDGTEPYSYELVPDGVAATDNDKFVISSAEVKVGANDLTEAKTYKIYVQATDSKGKTFKEGFDIPVAEA